MMESEMVVYYERIPEIGDQMIVLMNKTSRFQARDHWILVI